MKLPRARIFYFESDKAPLLLGAIEPIVRWCAARSDPPPIWVRSHWRQGPHVNLVGNMDDARFDAELMPAIREIAGEWLTLNPSTTTLDEEAYARQSQRLAIFELETARLAPIHANNSIERSHYTPNVELYGVEELAYAHADYNALSLQFIFDCLQLKQESIDRFYLRLIEAMALTGNMVRRHGLPRSFVSYRSHAEFFLANHDRQGRYRARLQASEAQLAGEIDAVIRTAHSVFEGVQTIEAAFPELAGWYRGVHALSERVYAVAEQNAALLGEHNRLERMADELVETIGIKLDPADARRESELELYVGGMPDIFSQVPHIAYRTMVNFFYGLLPVMSVAPIQKFALCHFIASGCERVFEKDWRQVVDEGRLSAGA